MLQMDDPIKGKASLLCGPHLCILLANPRDIQSQNMQILSHLSWALPYTPNKVCVCLQHLANVDNGDKAV